MKRIWQPVLLTALLVAAGLLMGGSSAGAREPGSREVGVQGSRGVERRSTLAPQYPSIPAQSRTVTYTYDAAGRLLLVCYGDGRSISYTYDDAGNLLGQIVLASLTADFGDDGSVTVAEIMQIAMRFGAATGEPLYDAAYDLNGDGLIDAADIQGAAYQWRLCGT